MIQHRRVMFKDARRSAGEREKKAPGRGELSGRTNFTEKLDSTKVDF